MSIEILSSDVYPYIDSYPIGATEVETLEPGDWANVGTDGVLEAQAVPTTLEFAHLTCPIHVEGDRQDVDISGRLDVYRGAYYRFSTDNYADGDYNAGDPLTLALDAGGDEKLQLVLATEADVDIVYAVVADDAAAGDGELIAVKVPPYYLEAVLV